MRIEWRRGEEHESYLCGEGAFWAAVQYRSARHVFASMTLPDSFSARVDGGFDEAGSDAAPNTSEEMRLPFICRTVERELADGAVLRFVIAFSRSPALQNITRRYAGTVYTEISADGAQVTVIND